MWLLQLAWPEWVKAFYVGPDCCLTFMYIMVSEECVISCAIHGWSTGAACVMISMQWGIIQTLTYCSAWNYRPSLLGLLIWI